MHKEFVYIMCKISITYKIIPVKMTEIGKSK